MSKTANQKHTSAGRSPKSSAQQSGLVKRHPDGFGFFIPDDPELPDVYIPRNSMEGIMTQDRVMVRVEKERGTNRFRGDIIKVLSRGQARVVGQISILRNGAGYLKDDNKGWGADLQIKPEDTMGAKEGELVAVDILKYPDSGTFTGKVSKVIGDIANPMNDIQRVLFTQNIPHEWSKATLEEAEEFSEEVNPRDIKGRKDLRKKPFVTIDGATAKDFDDAILVEKASNGWTLWVAIADVSHYVKPGTAMDEEAFERGNSVYFPNFVVPMLPEKLSNGLCSLNPNVDRLVLVAEIHLDHNGETKYTEFYEGVINSHARVTYGEAQQIVEGHAVPKIRHVSSEILRAADLAKVLMSKRFREGSLDLEIPEIQILIDETGNPVDIAKHERLFAHRLIEEMMLAANVAVAKFLAEREDAGFYRVHEPPNPQALAMLEKYLHNFGSSQKLSGGGLQKRLTQALEEFSGKPEAQILNILTLRSMAQAKYTQNNLGHFGLGFEFYTHFTSPIRRYPDLIVHRLLKKQIRVPGYESMSEEDLATAGTMLSATEQRAAKSERQHQAIKKARYMEKYIGEEFDGIISSVTKFGIFVLVRPMEVDGLISLEKLNKNQRDKMEFDEENLRLVQSRSGRAFEIGDRIRIKVGDVNTVLGQIDFELAQGEQAAEKGARIDKSARKQEHRGKPDEGRKAKHGDEKSFGKKGRNGRGDQRDWEERDGRPGRSKHEARSDRDERKSGRGSKKKNSKFNRDEKVAGKASSPKSVKRFANEESRTQERDQRGGGKKSHRKGKVGFRDRMQQATHENRKQEKESPPNSRSLARGLAERLGLRKPQAEEPKTQKSSGSFDPDEKLAQLRAKGGAAGGVKGMIKVRQNIGFKSKSGGKTKGSR